MKKRFCFALMAMAAMAVAAYDDVQVVYRGRLKENGQTAAVPTEDESARPPAVIAFSARGAARSAWRGYCSLPSAIEMPIQFALPESIASASPSPRSAT